MGVGGFNVVDPRGIKVPYVQGQEWRKNPVQRKVAAPPEERFTDISRKEEPYDSYSRWQSTLENVESHVKRLPREGRAPVAADIMSQPVVFLHPHDSLDEAWGLIRHSRFRHVPILSENGRLVGMVSDRGILSAIKDHAVEPKTVGEIMVRNILCAQPDTKVVRIAKVFIRERIGSMPILNDEEELVGMITRSDILRLMTRMPGLEFSG